MTGAQFRMARAALKMGVRDLAALAKVSPNTITRIEADMPSNSSTVTAIRAALEAAGVEFTNGDQPGVKLKKRPDTVADLTRQINSLQTHMTPDPGADKPSPERAMGRLKHARDENELVELKNRRAKVKEQK